MPLYEYECRQCHRRTEKIQKFSDPELTVCPYCSGPLERTITAAAIAFKGGGWYKDLYSSTKPPSSSGDASTAAPASGEPTKSTSDTAAPAAAAPAATPAVAAPSAPATPSKP